jgi:hypothetical protein
MMKSLLLALALVGSVLAQRKPSVGSILKIRLIDSDTNQPIAGYDPLPTTAASIDASTLPTINLAVGAITNGTVASVVWNINTTATGPASKAVNFSPVWVPCGKNGTDIFKCNSIQVGKPVTFQATPYSGKSATGTVGGSVSVSISLYHSNILTFTLIGTDYLPWAPQVGRRSLTVSAYSGTNGQGVLFSTATVSLKVDTKYRISPKINSFVLLTPTVNVSLGNPGTALLQIVVQDDYVGINGLSVGVDGFGTPHVNLYPNVWGNQATTFNISLEFAADTLSGSYNLHIWVVDHDSNGNYLNNGHLAALGLPSYIVVNNPDQDVTPPTLVSLTALSPMTVDTTFDDAALKFKVVTNDGQTGVYSCIVMVDWELAGYGWETKPVPGEKEFTVTLFIPEFTPAGTYNLQVRLEDKKSNVNVVDTATLAQLSFPSTFKVINREVVDNTPPKLLNFTVSSLTVPVGGTVTTTYTMQDEQSGFFTARVCATHTLRVGPNRCIRSPYLYTPERYYVGEAVFSFDEPGVYMLWLRFGDNVGNNNELSPEQLAALGYPNSFTVI